MAFLLCISLLVGLTLWIFTSEYGPLRDATPRDFVIYLRPIHVLVLWNVGCLIGLLAGHLLLTTPDFAPAGVLDRFRFSRVSYLAPLCLFAFVPSTVAAAMFGFYRWSTPWLYLFLDLRWWFATAVVAIQIAAIDDRLDGAGRTRIGPFFRRIAHERAWRGRLAVALCMLLAAFSAISSPRQRFHSIIVGDEPKYLRFLENWYRGQGLDISYLPPLNELPDDKPRLLRNVQHFASAAVTVSKAIVDDIKRLSGSAVGSSTNLEDRIEATAAGNWSIHGVHGGIYQGHHPGASLFLLPGYVLDRYLLNWTNIHQPALPTYLYGTNASMFVLYALWAVALYYLIAAHSENALLAFGVTAVVMMSLPATAFSYQYYAETAGGLVITLAVYFAIFMTDAHNATALACGLLTGFLPLMHPRWGPAAVIAAVTVAATRRQRRSTQMAWFFAGFVATLTTFILYTYYITGSMLPWTMYEIDPDTPGFSLARAMAGLPQLWLNWRWGLVAHAPVYLLALPGVILFFRRRPATATPTLAIVLATATLAAAHGWGGSGTTPCRLIAAVTPLLALPIVDACRGWARSYWFVAVAVLLSAVSIDNGFFYNVFFERSDVAFNAPSASGWKSPLLLARPDAGLHVDAMLIVWIAVTVALIGWPLLSRAASRRVRLPRPSWAVAAGVVLVIFASTGSLAVAYSGNDVGYRFLYSQDTVEQDLIRAEITQPDGEAWSARRGRIDLGRFIPNATDVAVDFRETSDDDPRNVDFVTELVANADGARQVAWGNASIDFGDGTSSGGLAVIGRAAVRHRYAWSGRYAATLSLARPGASVIRTTRVVMIPQEPPQAPPNWTSDYAVGIDVSDVLVEDNIVRVRCTIPSDADVARDAQWWGWMGTSENGRRGGALFTAQLVRHRTVNDRDSVEFSVQPPPAAGERVVLSVGMTGRRKSGKVLATRSQSAAMIWPAEYLTRGGALAARLTTPTSFVFAP